MRPIPTPKQVDDRLRTPNTGLRDRVLAAIEEAKTPRGIVVKVHGAGDVEGGSVVRELEGSGWSVRHSDVHGKHVIILNPKERAGAGHRPGEGGPPTSAEAEDVEKARAAGAVA